MPRLLLNDERWSKLRKILLQKSIYDKRDLRMTVEAMLYRMRTGCPWRDLPAVLGCWSSIYKRFNVWSAAGKWIDIFKALVTEPDWEWVFIDGSYAKAHQHSAGAASMSDEAFGKSRAGNTSKIRLAVNACGLPIEFEITGGQVSGCIRINRANSASGSDHCRQGCDSERIREVIDARYEIRDSEEAKFEQR